MRQAEDQGQASIPREELKSSLGVLAMVSAVEVEERAGREVEVETGLLEEHQHRRRREPSCTPQRQPPLNLGQRARSSGRSEEEPVEVEWDY